MSVVTSSAAELRREAAKAREIADELARQAAEAAVAEREASRPKMPVIPAGEARVVTFTRYQSGREYAYAALGWREGRSYRWAVTGSETRRFNWPGLLDFIGEANWASLAFVTAATPILPPGAEPPVAEEMARYGRVRRTVPVYDAQDEA
ncbi:hypothetical protein SEA_FUNSIZED_88 [Mycobacterium phage Funsized]|nr:hypothetical protein SEA_FUNSIZED_88 [Mycobacterium phage Funsized]